MTESVQLELRPSASGEVCRRILGELPEWFGIPEPNQDYIDKSDNNPTVVAIDNEPKSAYSRSRSTRMLPPRCI